MTHDEMKSDTNYDKALQIVMELDKYATMRNRESNGDYGYADGLPTMTLGEGYDGLAEMVEIVLNILNQK